MRIPEPGALGLPDAVQIWWVDLDTEPMGDDDRSRLLADLDPATQAKVRRYRRVEDQDRGLAGHALLRRVLAAAAGGRPAELVLGTYCAGCGGTDHGKPYLAPPGGPGTAPPVQVNLSHSGPVVAVALGPAGAGIGVDVEHRRRVDWTALRRSVFADEEWELTETAGDPDRRRTDLWSRKEAAVKASGHGLSLSLRRVLVADAVDPSGWEAALPDGAGSARGRDLELRADVAAAVAIHRLPGAPPSPGLPDRPNVWRVTLQPVVGDE